MVLFKLFDSIHKISDEAVNDLKQIISAKTYQKNEVIQKIGSKCSTVYFVDKGCARIFYLKDGNDITEHFAFQNELIIRAESLFLGNPTSKGIHAIDETRINGDDSESLL